MCLLHAAVGCQDSSGGSSSRGSFMPAAVGPWHNVTACWKLYGLLQLNNLLEDLLLILVERNPCLIFGQIAIGVMSSYC
jgi:hypothetical protein